MFLIGFFRRLFVSTFFWYPMQILFPVQRMTAAREIALLETIAVALERGISLDLVLDAYGNDLSGQRKLMVKRLAAEVSAGMPLADALQGTSEMIPLANPLTKHRDPTKLFSKETVAAIKVGEETNTLADHIRLGKNSLESSIDDNLSSAGGILVYFVGLGFVSVLIVGFIMVYIIPKFKSIFYDFDVDLPDITLALITVSDFVAAYWYLLSFPLFFLFLLSLARYAIVNQKVGSAFNWMIPAITRNRTVDLLRSLAICCRKNRLLEECIGSWAINHVDQRARRRLTRVYDEMSAGLPVWSSLGQQKFLTSRQVALLESAEQLGNLPWALDELAEALHQRQIHRQLIAYQFLKPMFILFMAGIVGFICIAMFYPLVSLLTQESITGPF